MSSNKNAKSWKDLMLEWIQKSRKAYDEGYLLESIAISFNCISFLLREAIALAAEKNGLEKNYSDRLFRDSANPLLGKISDRWIYNEIKRLKLIDIVFCNQLDSLHEERNMLFHRLFYKFDKGIMQKQKKELKIVARRYLIVFNHCLEKVACLEREVKPNNFLDKDEWNKYSDIHRQMGGLK